MYGVIYKLTNSDNDKIYIGQTTRTVEERFREHALADSVVGCAIRKHGKEKFSWEILAECESKEELDVKEIFYIAHLKAKDPNIGYNRTNGGDGTAGFIESDKTRAKKSESQKKRWTNPEVHEQMSEAQKKRHLEKPYTAETIAKMSITAKERAATPEGRKQILEMIAKRDADSFRRGAENLKKYHAENPRTDETCKKISKGVKKHNAELRLHL